MPRQPDRARGHGTDPARRLHFDHFGSGLRRVDGQLTRRGRGFRPGRGDGRVCSAVRDCTRISGIDRG
jgi:hypothetical protein